MSSAEGVNITLVRPLKMEMAEMGIDIDLIRNLVPETLELRVDANEIYVPDYDFGEVQVGLYIDGEFVAEKLTLTANGWMITNSAITMEGMLSSGFILAYAGDKSWQCSYANCSLTELIVNTKDGGKIYYWGNEETLPFDVEYTEGELRTSGRYDQLGTLYDYDFSETRTSSAYEDLSCQVAYELSGALFSLSISYLKNGIVVWYVYYPELGWEMWDDTGKASTGSAPFGYEDYDEAKIQKLYPPLYGTYRALPSYYDAVLPVKLLMIGTTAFENTPLRRIYIPDGAVSIGSSAFSECTTLDFIRIPASVTSIAADTFVGCGDVTIVTPDGSYAETYATAHGISCITE